MLESVLWILITGFFCGQVAKRLRVPAMIGMALSGVFLGPSFGNVISSDFLSGSDSLRMIAIMVILMKAGLGLDREKLIQQGSVALRLGFLPGAFEALAIAFASMWLFGFDFLTGLLLGCIIGAESPAVIVPGMLRLKSLGLGVKKGIPDAILTGSALSDVLLLLVFSLLLAFLSPTSASSVISIGGLSLTPLQLLPFQIIVQVVLGIIIGWIAARLLISLLAKQKWTQNLMQDALVAASLALLLVVLADELPIFSGYLAVMTTGYFMIEMDTPLASRLRRGFDNLWVVAEIFLFVLLGASLQLDVLSNTFFLGLLLLAFGLFVGRSLGWYFSTLGSNWSWKERLFLLPGNSAKATVQAAIGATPLALGIEGGETILAISALSILVTAPLGAWSTPLLAPKLLEKGEVDPTKVSLSQQVVLLAAIDNSNFASKVLTKSAQLARRGDSEVIVLHIAQENNQPQIKELRELASKILADIRYRFLITNGPITEDILRVAKDHDVSEIIVGKRGEGQISDVLIGSVSQSLLETSTIPVMVLEG